MRELTGNQVRYLGVLHSKGYVTHVLDSNVYVAHVLLINPDAPEELRRIYITPAGKRVANFKYRQVQDRAATAA